MLFRPDRRLTLQTFVPRRCNAHARAAAIQLAATGRSRLPGVLVVAGPSGCGKSHLLHAATRLAWQTHDHASCSVLGARQLADQVARGEFFGDLATLQAQLIADSMLSVDDVDLLGCWPATADFLLAVLLQRQMMQRPSLLSATLGVMVMADSALSRWLDQQPAVLLLHQDF